MGKVHGDLVPGKEFKSGQFAQCEDDGRPNECGGRGKIGSGIFETNQEFFRKPIISVDKLESHDLTVTIGSEYQDDRTLRDGESFTCKVWVLAIRKGRRTSEAIRQCKVRTYVDVDGDGVGEFDLLWKNRNQLPTQCRGIPTPNAVNRRQGYAKTFAYYYSEEFERHCSGIKHFGSGNRDGQIYFLLTFEESEFVYILGEFGKLDFAKWLDYNIYYHALGAQLLVLPFRTDCEFELRFTLSKSESTLKKFKINARAWDSIRMIT